MREVRFGLLIGTYTPLEMVRAGLLAEKYGFDSAWIPDHLQDVPPSGDRVEPWTVLAAIGVQTKHLLLSTAVTDVQRCHPARTAHSVATLDELTNGRAALGIGAGEAMNIVPYGIEWENPRIRVERLKEAIEVVKLLWISCRERPVSYHGKYYGLSNAWLDQHTVQKPHPPVYVGALGSHRTLKVAGELGDGWIPWFNTIETFKSRSEIIKAAAEKVGRSFEEIDRVAGVLYLAITKDTVLQKKAIDLTKAEVVVGTSKSFLKELGFEVDIPREAFYQCTLNARGTAEIAAKAAEGMPDEVVEKLMLIGGVEECIERVDAFIRAGARHVVIKDVIGQYVFGSLFHSEKELKTFGEKVIPYFKEETKG